MIAYLSGHVHHRDAHWLILTVQGVGYQVYVPQQVQANTGSNCELHCSQQVREDSQTLYGFPSLRERLFFELLLTVSGIGPKSALAILGLGSVDRLENAIGAGDPALFETVSGIGKKAAAKIIVELKSKITPGGPILPIEAGQRDLIDALEQLGYRRHEVAPIIAHLPADLRQLSDQIRWALRELGSPACQ